MECKGKDLNRKSLFEKYGHAVIPAGTLLYRGCHEDIVHKYMFFTCNPRHAALWGAMIQVWQAEVDIELIFLISSLSPSDHCKSALPDIFLWLFPDENATLNDLDIKDRQRGKDDKLIQALSKFGILGWFSSVEDKMETEICLFREADILRFLKKLDFQKPGQFDNTRSTLQALRLAPADSFFKQTKPRLERENFVQYSKKIERFIDDSVAEGMPRWRAEELWYGLRYYFKT